MPACRSLPPLLWARGVRPSHAANCRPERKSVGSGALAAMALAVIGPIPGMVASRRLVASCRCQASI